jgi:hypothetical protein
MNFAAKVAIGPKFGDIFRRAIGSRLERFFQSRRKHFGL